MTAVRVILKKLGVIKIPNTNIEIRIDGPKAALTASSTMIDGSDISMFAIQDATPSNLPP